MYCIVEAQGDSLVCTVCGNKYSLSPGKLRAVCGIDRSKKEEIPEGGVGTEVKKILEERREQGKAAPNLTFEKNRLQVSGPIAVPTSRVGRFEWCNTHSLESSVRLAVRARQVARGGGRRGEGGGAGGGGVDRRR